MSIIAKYKFDKSIYADLLPEFNAEFTPDKYNTTDEEVEGIITRTIESDELPTLMRFGRVWVDGESTTDNRTDSLLEVLDLNTSGLTSCSNMFRYNKNLTSITCEWDTSNVTNMQYMFVDCTNLASLDTSNFNTSNATDMFGMFFNCYNLTSLDVSNFNTSKVTTMSNMFFNCNNLTSLDLSNFNTSNVTDMGHMFYNCNKLITLDVSNFNTSNVTNMSSMFCNCNNLTSLDLSNFNTSKVTNTHDMFSGCFKLTSLDVSNFNTSKITNMIGMFYNCTNLTSLDLSNFDTSDVTDTTNMFYNTLLLTDIGMLYCDQSTINKIASLLPTDITQAIWVEDVNVKDLTPVEGVEFKQYAKNTEIMLTSPLLEGDKLIVKDGKLYHYHKMGMVVLNGSENWDEDYKEIPRVNTNLYRLADSYIKDVKTGGKFVCNNFANVDVYYNDIKGMNIYTSQYNKLKVGSNLLDLNEFKQWLSENPTTVVYELASPYYELISEDPLTISLIAESSDITNSSNIPLNMTINNKGLSTVAMSPSTTYTVAFDKEGEEDLTVNLCGNEITTSNNVVEITTSSELGNNELIFYGDGVEVNNVRLLEGSVSGNSIPKESFEGLKSSFEDGYIPENLTANIQPTLNNISTSTQYRWDGKSAEGGITVCTVYTTEDNISLPYRRKGIVEWIENVIVDKGISVYTAPEGMEFYCIQKDYGETLTNPKPFQAIVLEGDWTHLTEEDFNNLGKYKVEYKVTGKNKYNKDKYPFGDGYSLSNSSTDVEGFDEVTSRSEMFKLLPNTTYTCSADLTLDSNVGSAELFVLLYDSFRERVIINRTETISTGRYSVTFTTDSVRTYCELRFDNNFSKTGNEGIVTIDNLQIEEGTVATPYEPYKSYTKTFYLNSPLLEGDTIEDINGVATHVKRSGKEVLNGSEGDASQTPGGKWFRSATEDNVMQFVYQKVPKKTGFNTSICDKFLNTGNSDPYTLGKRKAFTYTDHPSLDRIYFNFGTPDTSMQEWWSWLSENPVTIVYQLASPIYEPISDESILCDSYVNGHLDFDSAVPIEKVVFRNSWVETKYLIPNTDYILQFEADNNGKIDAYHLGGTNLNNQNVTKGLNTVRIASTNNIINTRVYLDGIGFNASNIQVVATDRDVNFGYFKGLSSSFEEKIYNGDDNLFNKNSTIYEGLNEDITMKWFVIEKPEGYDCITIASKGETIKSLEFYESTKESSTTLYGWLNAKSISHISEYTYKFTTDNPYIIMAWNDTTYPLDSYFDRIVIEKGEKITIDLDKIGKYKVECKVVGKNKFDGEIIQGAWNTDAEFVNASIYVCTKNRIKVKPNTNYMISGNLTLTSSVVFIGKNGEHLGLKNYHYTQYFTTPNNCEYIKVDWHRSTGVKPNEFTNLQIEEGTQATSYEPYQEYTKTIHLNSPLLKGDAIKVHNGKLCHYHKMGMVVLDGSEDWANLGVSYPTPIYTANIDDNCTISNNLICDVIQSRPFSLTESNYRTIYSTKNATTGLYCIRIQHEESNTAKFKQWLQANPTTVVYELASPYYEEISPLQEDLIITSVKEGDLHIDTIVPVSSKVTYNVNVQLLTDFEQSIVEQVQATQTTDLQSILDEEIDN